MDNLCTEITLMEESQIEPLGNGGFSMIHLRPIWRQYYSHNGNKFPSNPLQMKVT